MKRTIVFHGALAKQLDCESICLDVNSPTELVSGLRSQVPKFKVAMRGQRPLHILLSNADTSKVEALTTDTFQFPIGDNASHIHMVPSTEGAGIEAMAITAFMAMGASAAVAATLATITINLAVAYAIGRISSMLAPSPDTSGGNSADARPSFLFNGAVNVVEQGYPVPLVYGVHTVGSIVISSGIDVAEMPYASTAVSAVATPAVVDGQWGI